MKKSLFLSVAAILGLTAGVAAAGTLDDTIARGHVKCGVSTGSPGFSGVDDSGKNVGFDVDYCRALASAIFNDPMAVKFTPLSSSVRFTALASGEVDILARNTTWTYSRDTDLKQTFLGVTYYDGQGFMVKTALGANSTLDLDGATICIQVGTTTELNLADYFKANGMTYEPLPTQTIQNPNSNIWRMLVMRILLMHLLFMEQELIWKFLQITWFYLKSFQKSLWVL